MCELFALSSNRPVALTLSLRALARHGGLEGPHRDGWGVAYYEDNDVRLIKEARAASESPWIRFLEAHALRSRLILSHIRHATQGARRFRNTQPFIRELGGRVHAFAHNGDLEAIRDRTDFAPDRYRPVGETDSEWAFCALLQRMTALWRDADGGIPARADRVALIADFAARLRALGPANFIYADGDTLFAHGHKRKQPETDILAPPGLWVLCRRCGPEHANPKMTGAALETNTQDVALLASVPLTTEAWRPLEEGEVIALRDGRIAAGTGD